MWDEQDRKEWDQMTVASVMTQHVEKASPGTLLPEVWSRMAERGISCIVVEDGGRPVGIFSERDAVRLLARNGRSREQTTLAEVMITPVESVHPEMSLSAAIDVMRSQRFRRFPVVDREGKLLGLVTQTDVLDGLRDELSKYATNLEEIVARRTEKIRKMKDLAVQVAGLGRELKTLDMEELLDIGCRQIPQLFEADSSAFVLPDPRGRLVVMRRTGDSPCCDDPVDRIDALRNDFAVEMIDGTSDSLILLGFDVPRYSAATGERQTDETQRGGIVLRVVGEAVEGDELTYAVSTVRNVFGASLTNAMAFYATREASRIDPLTALRRRHVFDDALEMELATSSRYSRPLSVALVDIDRFKGINDQWGHATGDAALATVAQTLAGAVRESDVAARYGGDELALLLPETSAKEAEVAAERVRKAVEEADFGTAGLHVTTSIGIAQAWPGDTAASVMRRADTALYKAKDGGRNRVCIEDVHVNATAQAEPV